MNLSRHAAVLWRFRIVTAVGVVLGILLAVLASYRVTFDGGLTLTPRGVETWSATSNLLVTQPGYPEGRVTLPQKQQNDGTTADGDQAVERDAAPKDQL